MSSKPSLGNFVDVCGTSEIPDGQARMFLVGDTRIAVYRIGDEFFALEDACPHAGASLALGLVSGDVVACRIHHWRFSIRSGEYLDGHKPSCNVGTYTVRVAEERIQVAV
jgi:NAD(P)H-dependent nitrite reductase small subunit